MSSLALLFSLAVFNPMLPHSVDGKMQISKPLLEPPPSATVHIAKATDPGTGYPIVDGQKWDREGPWYQPVLVQDPAGNYVAVLDKQRQGSLRTPGVSSVDKLGAFSSWSPQGIRVIGNGQFQFCVMLLCGTNYPRIAVDAIELKLNDQVFRPERSGDKFVVDAELAQALRTATPGRALLRLYLNPGVTITHAINDETVKAWPQVFQASSSILDGGMPIGGGALSTARVVAIAPFPALPPSATAKDWVNDPQTSLPLVNGSTWRTGRNVAWSRLVTVRDEFDGEYKAVLHQDGGLITNWSRNFVDVFASRQLGTVTSSYAVPSLHITVGDRTLNLFGEYNRFPIDRQAAQFLQQAGEKLLTGTIPIRYTYGKNQKREYNVDIGTAKAWATLYRN